MSLGAGALRIGGAGQICSKKRRYPWQPWKWPPPGTVTLTHSVEYLPPILTYVERTIGRVERAEKFARQWQAS